MNNKRKKLLKELKKRKRKQLTDEVKNDCKAFINDVRRKTK